MFKLRRRGRFLALAVTCLLCLLPNFCVGEVFANSAPLVMPDGGSGIVFSEHEQIKLESEVLNITINNNPTAFIEANYTLKNTSADALSVLTMFISPIKNDENKDILVKKNGEELEFSQQLYGLYSPNSLDIKNWQEVLQKNTTKTYPFGEGDGFYEYKIDSNQIVFAPNCTYFAWAGMINLDKNEVQLNAFVDEEILIVTRQNLELEVVYQKNEIQNIYDYLYKRATDGADAGLKMYAEQQFNLYLANVQNSMYQNFFYLQYTDRFVGATTYCMDFEPYQELNLQVSYVYTMGSVGYQNHADLLYYLTPAKYWKDNFSIEINLTLSEEYKKLTHSSVEFSRQASGKYRYFSQTLPKNELEITVSKATIMACFCGYTSIEQINYPLLFLFAFMCFAVIYKKKEKYV